jgi:hypothetical protein
MQRLAAEPGGASAFISGKEVLLAAVFLVLGGAILWFVLTNSTTPPDSEAIAAEEVSPSGESTITPEPVPETSAQQAAVPEPSDADTTDPETPILETTAAETTTAKNAVVKNLAPSTAAQARAASPQAPALSGAPESAPPASLRDSTATAAAAPPVSPPTSPPPSRPAPTPASRPPSIDRPDASSSGLSAPAGAVTLSAVSVLDVAGGLQIFAATNRRPEYKLFRVENPNRIVIDMPGTWMEIPRDGREQQVSHSIIKQLRVAQNQLDPPMVRLVLEVSSFPVLQVVPSDDGLTISVPGE